MAGIIDEVEAEGADALASMWELVLEGGKAWDAIKVRVENIPLILPKLTVERLPNGETFYSGVEFPLDFSLTIRESPSFKVFKYFTDWWNDVYDTKERRFKSYLRGKKGDGVEDKIHRSGSLTFFTFRSDSSSDVVIQTKENTRGFADEFEQQQIVQNPVTGIIKNVITSVISNTAGSAASMVGGVVSVPRPAPPTIKVSHSVSVIGTGGESDLSTLKIPNLKSKATCRFDLTNLKILGFDQTQLSYEGGPLKFQVSFSAEDVIGSVQS